MTIFSPLVKILLSSNSKINHRLAIRFLSKKNWKTLYYWYWLTDEQYRESLGLSRLDIDYKEFSYILKTRDFYDVQNENCYKQLKKYKESLKLYV